MGEGSGGQGKELIKNGSELEPGFSLGPGGALEWESHHRVLCALRHGAFHSNVHHCCGYLRNRLKSNLLGKMAPCSLLQGSSCELQDNIHTHGRWWC